MQGNYTLMTTTVVVSEPEEIDVGVYRTTLTIPELDGDISFVHSRFTREETLKKLDASLSNHTARLKRSIEEFKDVFTRPKREEIGRAHV